MEETMWDVWYIHKGNIEMGPQWMVEYSFQFLYKNKMEFLYQINSCQLLKENPTL